MLIFIWNLGNLEDCSPESLFEILSDIHRFQKYHRGKNFHKSESLLHKLQSSLQNQNKFRVLKVLKL